MQPVTNTINDKKYSVEFEKVCKPGKEEKCVTVIDVVNEQTCSPTTERMCTNVIEEVCSSDEEQDCNTVIDKKCHVTYERDCRTSTEEKWSTVTKTINSAAMHNH